VLPLCDKDDEWTTADIMMEFITGVEEVGRTDFVLNIMDYMGVNFNHMAALCSEKQIVSNRISKKIAARSDPVIVVQLIIDDCDEQEETTNRYNNLKYK